MDFFNGLLENGGYMDLVIGRQGNTVMVGHYANMNGDLVLTLC
ncbi:hypothetical protein DCCM_2898 [Desulfocucumis palustris]|uniref:Uncharacterized protein n=1 Tax=Desulfocucumis palustris TaxID=1898651 RepID=A0A2L2XBU3_9FIRM|nr:hypothetical protein DCCM_2898 [Desulfocucumis palustris]